MVGKLGHHHVGQQARRRDAFVDDMCRHRRLDQCFALFTGPFPPDMTLNRKDAGRVVELFTGIFADTFEGAAALAVAVVRFVMDQRARKLRWQRCALGLLAHFGFDRCRLQRLKFGFDSGDIRIDQVVEQVGLIRAQLLAALGKLEAFEQRDLVGQFLVDRFLMIDLLVPVSTRWINCAAKARSSSGFN